MYSLVHLGCLRGTGFHLQNYDLSVLSFAKYLVDVAMLLRQVAQLEVEIHGSKEVMQKEVKQHKAEAARLQQELAASLAALESAKANVMEALGQQVQQLKVGSSLSPDVQGVAESLEQLQHSLLRLFEPQQQQQLWDAALAATAAAAAGGSLSNQQMVGSHTGIQQHHPEQQSQDGMEALGNPAPSGSPHGQQDSCSNLEAQLQQQQQEGVSQGQLEQMQEQVLRLAEQLALAEDSRQELQQQLAAAGVQLESQAAAVQQQALLQQQLEEQAVLHVGLEEALADARREVDWAKEQLATAQQVSKNLSGHEQVCLVSLGQRVGLSCLYL